MDHLAVGHRDEQAEDHAQMNGQQDAMAGVARKARSRPVRLVMNSMPMKATSMPSRTSS